jgi:hypothetical protein
MATTKEHLRAVAQAERRLFGLPRDPGARAHRRAEAEERRRVYMAEAYPAPNPRVRSEAEQLAWAEVQTVATGIASTTEIELRTEAADAAASKVRGE